VSTPYRPCPQCGMPLVPMQGFCNNCGARFINDSTSFVPAKLAPPPGATDARQMQLPSTPLNRQPFPPYNGAPYESDDYRNGAQIYTQSPSPIMGYPSPDSSATTGEYSPSNPYRAGPQADPYGQQPSSSYPRNARKRRRRKRINFLVPVLAILTVIVLVGGALFVYASTKTTGNIATTPTPTSQLASPTALSKQAPLFTDNFANNSKNWDLRSAAGFGATIGNNMLTMKEANHRIFQEPVPATVPNDFMVTTTFTLAQGDSNDSIGLQLRTGQNNSQGYVVEVYGDDTFDIVKVAPAPNNPNKLEFTTLSAPASSAAIKTKGTPNTLLVIMKGSNMVVQFNGTVVKTLTDPSFNSGSINLFQVNGNTSNGTVATFTNFAIYPAPPQLPS
jgi:predicted nucleic acid-binding Zn ribbon protein